MSTVYEIGPFRLDAEAAVLTHAGVPMALGSRGVAVLRTLVERPREFVAKDSIIDAAWPGVVVEESNLAVQIAAIRRVLAKVPGGEGWIETLPRRGYRFVGPVTELSDSPGPASAGELPRSNLPAPVTSFIGRERELVEIKRLLPGKRLVTLVGVGGIGKTRLALQLASEVLDAYRDGVWLVEFGAIADPTLVPTTVAQVLGVQETSGTSPTQALCSHLKARQILLILDNCEHLVHSCAQLADAILRGAADATIIATSREPLHIAGEQTYLLPTLSLPEPTTDAETIGSSEAVQLFIERAQSQQSDFCLTAARAPIVAQLCIHLDGIPLALELAAARIRSLSVEQINGRLGDRFRLLTGGSSTAMPRQQTLRATLDWSYGLLPVQERAVLCRLGVFHGTFTLEAASAVACDASIDEYAVIDLLTQLVARSLVVVDTSDAHARYRLLETTRTYALEKLAEAQQTDDVKRRHGQYFRDLFEQAAGALNRMPDADWRAVYVPELDNVRAALDWAVGDRGDPAICVALAGASGPLWADLALVGEGRQRLEAALARVESQTSTSDVALLWYWLGSLEMASPSEVLRDYERAIELYRPLGDGKGLGSSLMRQAAYLTYMGRFEQAAPLFAQAFPLLEVAAAPKLLAEFFLTFGAMKMLTGDLTTARSHFERAASICRSTGAERLAIGVLHHLGEAAWTAGDLDAALAGYRETVALARKSRVVRKRALGHALTNLAGVLTERGDIVEALVAAREGLPLRLELGDAWGTMDHHALRTALAGKLANAARLSAYADSSHAANETSRQPNEARARDRLRTLLRERFSSHELDILLVKGATMTQDEAVHLALEE